MKTHAQLIFLAVFAAPILCARIAPAQDGQDGPLLIEDKEAKVLVADFKKMMKAGKKDLKMRLTAVEQLGRHQNKLLVKPLLTAAKSDRAKSVRQAATAAIGAQPRKNARTALFSLLKKFSIQSDPAQIASIIRAINASCYRPKDWPVFKRLFIRVLTNPKAVDAQKAILEMAGEQEEVEAVDFLIEHIDGPQPAWVDAPNNPPASYWEARWKNWQKWRHVVKESLYQITGQRFGTMKEARTWLRKNRKKLKRKKPKPKR